MQRGNGVQPWLALVRWPNVLLAAASVVAGAAWALGRLPPVTSTALAAVAIGALTAFANAWNDYDDRAIDAVAHPHRPLPSGALRPSDALAVAVGAGCVAWVLSGLARPELGAVTSLVIVAVLCYSRLKARNGFAANAVVALVASLPFVYGAWAVGEPARGALLALAAAPLHLAREVAKDLDDAPADAPFRRTVPIAAGARVARWIIAWGTLAALPPLAVLTALRREVLLWAAVPSMLLCAYACGLAVAGRRGSARWYKWGMASAVAALLTVTLLASPTGRT